MLRHDVIPTIILISFYRETSHPLLARLIIGRIIQPSDPASLADRELNPGKKPRPNGRRCPVTSMSASSGDMIGDMIGLMV